MTTNHPIIQKIKTAKPATTVCPQTRRPPPFVTIFAPNDNFMLTFPACFQKQGGVQREYNSPGILPHLDITSHEYSKSLQRLKVFLGDNLPGQLVIQYSNSFNAGCTQCDMRRTADVQRYTLTKDKVKCLIDDAARNNVPSLSLTGGEPLLFLDNIIELIN